MEVKRYRKQIMMDFIDIDGLAFRLGSVYEVLEALDDPNVGWAGSRIVINDEVLLNLLETHKAIERTIRGGVYRGPEFEAFCKAVGYYD